ncbi:MAG: LysR family transcriptional regulator [Luteimonas sp.]
MDRIDALRLLLDVADAGSFSGVARQRSIATSTVALAVSQLEQEFGQQIVIRSTRKLVFTHEGDILLADARRIVSAWDAAADALREDGRLSGPLRVTATNDFGRTRVRPLLDAFQAQHPDLHVTLVFNDSTLDLIDHHIDLALRSGPLPDSSLRARLLIRGRRLVCAAPAYWARAGRPAHPHDLQTHNCIILARPDAPLSPWPFVEDGKPFNVKVSGDRQASDGDVLRHWAIEGHGVIVKNEWDIRDDRIAGRLETVLDDYAMPPIDLYAVYPSGATSRRLSALIDFLADALQTMPEL